MIETACIGGASGSIPLPTKKLEYPIWIADYEDLLKKKFDYENYLAIKFRYYVGELELQRKTEERFDEFGKPAPMHDMSYFDRSVPVDIGKKQRKLLGQDMFESSYRTIDFLKSIGLDVDQKVFKGKTHNNINGQGVNELGICFFVRFMLKM